MDYHRNATIYRKWLYIIGIFPYFNKKSQSFEPNKRKAIILTCIYIGTCAINTYHKSVSKFYANSMVFKAFSEYMAHGVVINWMLCNNTFFTPKLTEMNIIQKRANVHLPHLKAIIVSWNIVFFLITLAFFFNFLVSLKGDVTYFVLPTIMDIYTIFCLHTMNFARLLFCFSMSIKFARINNELKRIGFVPLGACELLIARIAADHNSINNWVDLYNAVFGFETLLVKLYELFHILVLLECLLTHESLDKTVMILAWTCYVCGQGILTAHVCQRFTNYGRDTLSITYNLLHRYEQYGRIREQLYILAQQAAHRCPKFTAWGFFPIDHTVIFMFANLAATYVIVIVQLKQPQLG